MKGTDLEHLQDIVLASDLGYFPLAPGVILLLMAFLIYVSWVFFSVWRHHQTQAYRRWACGRVRALRQDIHDGGDAGSKALVDMALIMKKTALCVYPREEVASLTGRRWLTYLVHTSGIIGFQTWPGNSLATLAYGHHQAEDLNTMEREVLLSLCLQWIKTHHVD